MHWLMYCRWEYENTGCIATVMIYENILNSPIPVEAGDVLGILFQADNLASYIPLLYNVTGSGGLVSYYRTAWGSPPGDVFTLTGNSVAQDTLFPLISLQMCKWICYIYITQVLHEVNMIWLWIVASFKSVVLMAHEWLISTLLDCTS